MHRHRHGLVPVADQDGSVDAGGLAITTMMPVHLDSLLKSAETKDGRRPKNSSQTAPGRVEKKVRTDGGK